jgi:hypothetical protein
MASVSAAVAVAITDAPGNSVCVPCRARGHVCFAQKMVDGEAWCIYCLDDQPCIWEQKQKGAMRRKLDKVGGMETEEGVMAVEGAERESTSGPERPATPEPEPFHASYWAFCYRTSLTRKSKPT